MDMVNYKVILIRPDDSQEARRFALPGDVSTSLLALTHKLEMLFPELNGKMYRIFWKDEEDDNVVIKSNEELTTALFSLPDLKKIYVDFKDSEWVKDSGKEIHNSVTCDECGNTVIGFRYKCLQCTDYDLCESCESKHLHSFHIMMRIPKELPHRSFHGCWSRIFSSVDHMAKSMESGRHLGRDHSDRCGRRCGGKHRRSCNNDGKDSDGGAHDAKKEKHEEADYVGLFSWPIHHEEGESRRRGCPARTVPHDIEDAVLNTIKFFVGAVKDGFTPKTRSEKGMGESSEQSAASGTKNENEKKSEDQQESEKKMDELNKKLSEQHLSEKDAEPFPAPSAPKADSMETKPEAKSTGNIYPAVPMDPKIEEALRGMLAMGFSNEGGTLQKMLEEMDGDIMKVLECIDSSLM